eukprot:jgi/Mesvir1/6230/Mv00908-RA.1
MAEVSPRLITLDEATSPLSAKSSLWKFKARKPWTSRPGGNSEKSLAVVGISNHYADWQDMQNGTHAISSPGHRNGQAPEADEGKGEANFYYSGLEPGEEDCAFNLELDRLERGSSASPELDGPGRGPGDGAYGLHDVQSMPENEKRAFMQRLDSFRQRPGIGHFKDCTSFAPTSPLHSERSSVSSVHRAAHFQSPLVSLYTDGVVTGELPAFRTWAAALSETPPLSDVTFDGSAPVAVELLPVDGVGVVSAPFATGSLGSTAHLTTATGLGIAAPLSTGTLSAVAAGNEKSGGLDRKDRAVPGVGIGVGEGVGTPQAITVTMDNSEGMEGQVSTQGVDAEGRTVMGAVKGEADDKAEIGEEEGVESPLMKRRRRRLAWLLCCVAPGQAKRTKRAQGEGKDKGKVMEGSADGGAEANGKQKNKEKKRKAKEKKGEGPAKEEAVEEETVPHEVKGKGSKGKKKAAKPPVRRLSDAVYSGEVQGIVMRGRMQAMTAQRQDFTVIQRPASTANGSRRSSISAGSGAYGPGGDAGSSHGGVLSSADRHPSFNSIDRRPSFTSMDRRLSFENSSDAGSTASERVIFTAAAPKPIIPLDIGESDSMDVVKLPNGAVVLTNRPPLGPRHARTSSTSSLKGCGVPETSSTGATAAADAATMPDLTRPQRQAGESATAAVLASASAMAPSMDLRLRVSSGRTGAPGGMLASGGPGGSGGGGGGRPGRGPSVGRAAATVVVPSPPVAPADAAGSIYRRTRSDGDLGAFAGGVVGADGAAPTFASEGPVPAVLPPVPCKVQGNPAFANLGIMGQTVVNGELQVRGEMPPGTKACRFQWTRLRTGKGPGAARISENIPGAVAPVYVPQMEDIGCYLFVSLAAVGQGGALSAPAAAICGPITFSRRFASISRAGSMGSVAYASVGATVMPSPSSSVSAAAAATAGVISQAGAGAGAAASAATTAAVGAGASINGLRINTGSVTGAGSAAGAMGPSSSSSAQAGPYGLHASMPPPSHHTVGVPCRPKGGPKTGSKRELREARGFGDIDLATRSTLGMVSESDEEWTSVAPRGVGGSGMWAEVDDAHEWALGIGSGPGIIGRFRRQSWGGVSTPPQGSEAGSARGLELNDDAGVGAAGSSDAGSGRDHISPKGFHATEGLDTGRLGVHSGPVVVGGIIGRRADSASTPEAAPASPNPEDLLRAASLGQLRSRGEGGAVGAGVGIGRSRFAGQHADADRDSHLDARGAGAAAASGAGDKDRARPTHTMHHVNSKGPLVQQGLLGRLVTPGDQSTVVELGASGSKVGADQADASPPSGRSIPTTDCSERLYSEGDGYLGQRSEGDGDGVDKCREGGGGGSEGTWAADADVSAAGSGSAPDAERSAPGLGGRRGGGGGSTAGLLAAFEGVAARDPGGSQGDASAVGVHSHEGDVTAYKVAGSRGDTTGGSRSDTVRGAGVSHLAADVDKSTGIPSTSKGDVATSSHAGHGAGYAHANGHTGGDVGASKQDGDHGQAQDKEAHGFVTPESSLAASAPSTPGTSGAAAGPGVEADVAAAPVPDGKPSTRSVASHSPTPRIAPPVKPAPMRAAKGPALKPVNRASHHSQEAVPSAGGSPGAGTAQTLSAKAGKGAPVALTAGVKSRVAARPRQASVPSGATKPTPRSSYLATNTTAGAKKYRQ